MNKKFTEEQYREIIMAYENNYGSDNRVIAVIRVVDTFNDGLSYNEALALANPAVREWAHEQFVDKEKRYVWTSKKPYYEDFYKRLYMASDGLSKGINGIGIASYEKLNVSEDEYLTATEVRNNGYNPEMFDKEEVHD